VAKQSLRYAIVFHDKEPKPSELAGLGAAFNHPLIAVPLLLQEGQQPTTHSYLEVETPNVVLSTLKMGEDSGVIVRLVEQDGKHTMAKIRIGFGTFTSAEV